MWKKNNTYFELNYPTTSTLYIKQVIQIYCTFVTPYSREDLSQHLLQTIILSNIELLWIRP